MERTGQNIASSLQLNEKYLRGYILPQKTSQKAYFVLDIENEILHIFKNLDQGSNGPIESVQLSVGSIQEKMRVVVDIETGKILDSFDYQIKERSNLRFTVLAEQQNFQNIRKSFEELGQTKNVQQQMKQSDMQEVLQLFSQKWKEINYLVLSLEKIGEDYEANLGNVLNNQQKDSQVQQPSPQSSSQDSIISNLFSAVAGIVAEPILGAKEGGVRGGVAGLGRGLLGLIWSPILGTFQLVTQSTKAVSDTPQTMYVGFNKILKRISKDESSNNPNEPLSQSFNPENHILIGEDNGHQILLNRKRLREAITNSRVLSDLLFECDRCLSEEEKFKMKSVIMRQRELLKRKDSNLQDKVIKKDQIKTITEELLTKLNEDSQVQKPISQQNDDQDGGRDSETSSMADEREIHDKLQLILQIIREREQNLKTNDQSNQPVSVEELAEQSILMEQRFIQDIFEEAQNDDIQLYMIQASQLQGLETQDEKYEFENFFADIKRMNRKSIFEEEQKVTCALTQSREIAEQKLKERQDEFFNKAKSFRGFTQYRPGKDDYRHPTEASPNGGIQLTDSELIHRLRSSGKEMLKTIGRKLLSGSFNLTTVSFPIKCMCAKSTLESIGELAGVNPIFINAAALSKDPIERVMMAMTSAISYFYPTHMFEKPLNPILGETFQALGQDGTQIFVEQTEHRPPVTHFLFEGPQNLYRMYGWSSFVAKAWINSISLKVEGRKCLEFQDGTKIEWNVPGDQFNNIFMGTIVHQVTSKIEFHYKAHNIYGFIDIGNVKKKPQDQFVGEIHWNGKKLIEITGNYMGYIDIGGVRYMDLRELENFYFPIERFEPSQLLPSDSLRRSDSVSLKLGDVKKAQKNKEEMEIEQRHDRKLRETVESRRKKKNGKKFANVY